MTRKFFAALAASAAVLAAPVALTTPATAQPLTLEQFEGKFTGGGTLVRKGSTTNLTCNLTGDANGDSYTLAGRCRANIIAGGNIRIAVRQQGNRITGSFSDGLGTVSSLSGTANGSSLSMVATETAESVRPDPPARMTLTRSGSGLTLSVRNTQEGAGSNITLSLRSQ